MFSPIALFTFKRPEHTRRTLEALAKNPEFVDSQLFIFCDGPREEREAELVLQNRELVQEWNHPYKTIIEHDQNMGLANSIISGVTQITNEYGRVIVLEDDMVTSPFFLNYMNSSLVKYQDDDRVISIHGYSYPIDDLPETFFIKGASCWGWATWKRGWDLFENNGEKLLVELRNNKLMHRFDVNGGYPYRRMLLDQIHGRIDSWAIRWYASALINQKLTLHPGRSLIHNIGLDGSGSNCDEYDGFNSIVSSTPIDINNLSVSENLQVLDCWRVFMKTARRKKILKNIFSFHKLYEYFSRRIRY